MSVVRFVDTNVLLYAVSALSEDVDKRLRALNLLNTGDLALSVQVMLNDRIGWCGYRGPGKPHH